MTSYKHAYKGAMGCKAIAERFNINVHTLRKRLKQCGIKEAVTRELHKKRYGDYEYNGVYGLPEIARANDIGYQTLYYRINKMGLSVKQAVELTKEECEALKLKKKQATDRAKREKELSAIYQPPKPSKKKKPKPEKIAPPKPAMTDTQKLMLCAKW